MSTMLPMLLKIRQKALVFVCGGGGEGGVSVV